MMAFLHNSDLDIFCQYGKITMNTWLHYLVIHFLITKGNRGFVIHTFGFPEMDTALDPLCLSWNDPKFFCFLLHQAFARASYLCIVLLECVLSFKASAMFTWCLSIAQ